MASAEGDDTDVFAWHAEPPLAAVNLFHLRGGRVVDRRDFFWEDHREFEPGEFLSSLLKQLYLDSRLPSALHPRPVDFEDRELLEEILSERAAKLDRRTAAWKSSFRSAAPSAPSWIWSRKTRGIPSTSASAS